MPTPIDLSRLPTGSISSAKNALPVCREDSPERVTGSVEVPRLGLVSITFTKFKHTFHRSRRYFWNPEKAELVEHVCDRKGKPTEVIDDPDGENLSRILPTCSVCGRPQPFSDRSADIQS